MLRQWITAARALEVVPSQHVLCARLHAGLVQAKAQSFHLGEVCQSNTLVPKEFWWAEGHAALDQNWPTGDFATTMGHSHAKAFGVMIDLIGLLAMLDIEQRALTARRFSVAGNPDWVTAKEARRIAIHECGHDPFNAARAIIDQAGLGFAAARAVLAQGVDDRQNYDDWHWQEREWDIPEWFWNDFTGDGSSSQNWETGKFSGSGISPTRLNAITLTGVHFYLPSIAPHLANRADAEFESAPAQRGRKPTYDWDAAVGAIWGRIYRGDFVPDNQAQIEKAMMALLAKGDKEPSESTVRPYASRIWSEMQEA